MSKFPSFTSKELVKLLKKNGFVLLRSKGSHNMYHNPVTKRKAIIPLHNANLPKGTLLSILKRAGIDKEDL